jgi:predicted nucleic acid-binding protein
VVPLDVATHENGLRLAERHGFSVYDAMIVASALLCGCRVLLTEDLNDGQQVEGFLTIENPFI